MEVSDGGDCLSQRSCRSAYGPWCFPDVVVEQAVGGNVSVFIEVACFLRTLSLNPIPDRRASDAACEGNGPERGEAAFPRTRATARRDVWLHVWLERQPSRCHM